MKTNLLKWIALLSLIAPLAANAAPIIYDVSSMIGTGSVTGTITTDGTIGVLGSTNLDAWAVTVNDGVDFLSFSSTDAGAGFATVGSGFLSTASALFFDFSALGPFLPINLQNSDSFCILLISSLKF